MFESDGLVHTRVPPMALEIYDFELRLHLFVRT
jgi:hypothetical protein